MQIPKNWKQPKYHFGQRVKQGIIVGCSYYPQGTKAAYRYGSTWKYAVISHNLIDAENIECYPEPKIQLLTAAELLQQIQEEIDFHSQQLADLNKQISELEVE